MRHKPLLMLLAIVAMCLVDAKMARGDTIEITNADAGWYESTGTHFAPHTNYASGGSGPHYRNFFVFDLSAATGETITSAQLQLWTYGMTGSGTYTTYDVVTPVSILTAGGSGQFATYADLGSGVSFGSIGLTTAESFKLILITLNAAAIAAIQAQADLSAMFAIGGDFTSSGFAFGSSSYDSRNRLILQTQAQSVPDSGSTMVLILLVILFAVVVKFSRLVSA